MKSLLALDPGKVNFGYSVLDWKDDGTYRVRDCGILKHTITELKRGLPKSTRKYGKEVSTLVNKYDIEVIIAERFVSRGLLGSLSEYVNIMLGITSVYAKKDFLLIIPATWKNRFNKKYPLKNFYRDSVNTKHSIDATLIGVYYINTLCGKETYFRFESKDKRNHILKQMQENGI